MRRTSVATKEERRQRPHGKTLLSDYCTDQSVSVISGGFLQISQSQ